ncbi:MAG: right-handed parallel beta-helix repeat-containing protein, partial [Bacteroidota bacterium]|nr:right-handed parallel beta-helix repeat-containing protein [Bacteroidota bacterium]
CIIRHSGHYRPAVLIKESSNIKLEDVKIHEQPGMGVVGHRSENITLKNVQIVPIAGRFISTNTDATHFTSCKGRILMDGCKFEGQGDDCTNIHNYYYTLYPEKAKNQICIKVENADLHALSLDYPDKGDTLNLVSRETLEPIGHYIVKDVKVSEKDWKVTVTLNKEIPSDYEHYYMTNESRKPSVALFNNTVRSHLARAFLIKTDNVQIKGNVIQNCTGTAIQIGAEGTWRECGPVKNLMIEDNWFIDCGYDGHGTQENTSAICINISGVKNQTQGLHRNITIRNNNINAACENAIYISSAQNINVINNNIANCKNSVFIQYSKDILIRNNGTIPVKIGDHVECQNVR